jgi:cyclopropane fatty-acyl-phospholipid synthase-like methyltransferase
MAEEELRDWETLCELIWGCAIGQALHVFVELDIPDVLAAAPRSADHLAATTGADPWTLETVLRGLTAYGVVSVDGEQRYALTKLGRLLLRSADGPSAGEAREFFDTIYRPLGALSHMIKTGGTAFDHVYGTSFYDHLARSPALSAHFYDTMAANAPRRYAGLSSVVDFSGVTRVVDVGGADGSLVIQLLREHPRMRGVVFDAPAVCDRATARIGTAGLADRCEVLAGDFRTAVPAGGGVYVLAHVLNNFGDAAARRVLDNCRAAMDDGARLLVLEPVYVAGAQPRWAALVSIGVMAQRGGRTRSETQLRSLLGAAGFSVESVRTLPASATCATEAWARPA